MKISVRGWLVVSAFAITALGVTWQHNSTAQAQPGTAPAPTQPRARGAVSEQTLGQLLAALGLKTQKEQSRYDFTFKTKLEGEEWNLSMSAVLSQDEKAIWIMAWLDELPKSANDIPRTALLRLLADNDKLGNGKFFAYIASNRRFVIQRVVPNAGVTTTGFRNALTDLGKSVVQTYPHWSTANWKATTGTTPAKSASQTRTVPK